MPEEKSEIKPEIKTELKPEEKPVLTQDQIDAQNYRSLMENNAIMSNIVRAMKEIPELPSEKPRDVHPLLRVEFPEKGGIQTYMDDYPYPYRGFPYFEFVDKIDFIKKVVRGLISGLYHALKSRNKIWFITLLPTIWVIRSVLIAVAYTFYRVVERFKIKTILYSQSIRELHRAFSLPRDREPIKIIEFRLILRDLICMVFEFDNAYRYRFQDLIEYLDKKNLKENPIKELNRLITIAQDKETTQEIKDTWKLGKIAINYYLRLDKELLKLIVDVFSSLNIEECKLSVEDKCFCEKRKDYTFSFTQVK